MQWLALMFIELRAKRESESRTLGLWVAKVTRVRACDPLMLRDQEQRMGRGAPWSQPQEPKRGSVLPCLPPMGWVSVG